MLNLFISELPIFFRDMLILIISEGGRKNITYCYIFLLKKYYFDNILFFKAKYLVLYFSYFSL